VLYRRLDSLRLVISPPVDRAGREKPNGAGNRPHILASRSARSTA
jgi:hypothetical protein